MIGKWEELILLALVQKANASVTEIFTLISDRTGKEASLGAIYTTLDRLEEKKFVLSKNEEVPLDGRVRKRKRFTITGVGQYTLQESLRMTKSMEQGLQPAGVLT